MTLTEHLQIVQGGSQGVNQISLKHKIVHLILDKMAVNNLSRK